MLQLLVLATLVASTIASYGKNLNYRSPSHHHPGLGINLRKIVKRNDPRSAFASSSLNFTHGVASGDPFPNSVIIWTRCSPQFDDVKNNDTVSGFVAYYPEVPIYNDTDSGKPPSNAPVCVQFKVSTDPNVTNIVDQGTVYTSSDVDYTVKIEATNLKPFSTYFYQFNVCNSNVKSPIGRTKTSPSPTDDVSGINLAVLLL